MLMEKLTVRLSPRQLQVLTELTELYNCSYSLLVRAIIGSWITTNEPILEAAMNKKLNYNKNDYTEEGIDYSGLFDEDSECDGNPE